MKRSTSLFTSSLSVLAMVVFCAAPVAAQSMDNFDSYTAGLVIPPGNDWVGWGGDVYANCIVTAGPAYSLPNSLAAVGGQNTDQCYEFGYDAKTGAWTFSAQTYLPSAGASGKQYFNLMNLFDQGAGTYQWSNVEFYWDMDNTDPNKLNHVYLQDTQNTNTLPIQYDTWVEVKAEIDLDLNTVEVFYGGASLSGGTIPWSDNPVHGIDVMDIFPPQADASVIYYDDISLLFEQGLSWNGGAGTSAPADGGGTWNATDPNWWGASPTVWVDNSKAVFGVGNGAAGDVAVEGAVKPEAITFNAAGSGTYRLTQGAGGVIDLGGNVVKVTANADAEIQTVIANGGMSKWGDATLTLSGANTYTGATTVQAGGLTVSGSLAGDVSVNGGEFNLSGTLGAGTTLALLGGTVHVTGTGGTAAKVILPQQGSSNVFSAPAGQELTVTETLTLPTPKGTVTVTAGATPFKAGGSNMVSNVDSLILQGGTTTIGIDGNVPGLDIRGWQADVKVDNNLDGAKFDLPGTPSHSTYAGTLGYATEAINMNGNDKEHFEDGSNSGVPDSSSLRPTGYQENYALEYRGKLRIDTDGTYRFATNSDDGSALWISPLVDNPNYVDAAVQNEGSHGMRLIESGQYNLTAGYYDFIVRFEERGGGNGLQVLWDTTGGSTFAPIPGANYYHVIAGPLALDMPDTAVTVTSNSTLALPAVSGNKLGELTLNSGSQLTLSGATEASFSGFTGAGSVVGAVIVPAGGEVSPGTDTSIGALATGGLTLESGCLLTFNVDTGSNLDQVDVTDANGLSVLGGGLTLLNAAGSGAFSTPGTYNLISYLGDLAGDVANMSVENKAIGRSYTFGSGSGFVTLTIGAAGYWDGGAGTANWSDSLNWNGISPVTGDFLVFGSAGAGGAVLNNDLVGESYAGFHFYAGAPAFTLGGNGVTLTGDGVEKTIIQNDSTATQTVDLAITLAADGTIDAAAGDIVVSGGISGGYGLTKVGGGRLTLSGINSYTGGTTINEGVLAVDTSTLGAAGASVTLAGGALDLGGSSQSVGAVSVTEAAAGGDTIANGSLAGTSYAVSNPAGDAVISASLLASGSAGLTKSGGGTATLSGANTYTGDTAISAGALRVGAAGAIPHGAGKGNVVVDGTLDLSGLSPTVNGLTGGGIVTSSVAGTATLTVGDADSASDFTGTIEDGSGTVALVKTGSDIVVLGSANAHSGGTTINSGTVKYRNHDAFGASAVTLAGGVTFIQATVEGRYKVGNEDLANDIVLSGGPANNGLVNVPLAFGSESKDIWLKGNVSGPGGFNVTGSSRDLSLSGDNTFQGGLTLTGSSNGVVVASYSALGTGTLTLGQNAPSHWRHGVYAGENLDGTTADPMGNTNPNGIENPIVILAGKYGYLDCFSDNMTALFSGPISGDGTLAKDRRNSTIILAGDCTHTGGTIVEKGTLTINGTLADATMTIDNVNRNGTASPGIVNGSGTLTFNIDGAACDLIQVINDATLDITNLGVDFDAFNLSENRYVLVDWEIDTELPGNLIGNAFASAVVPTGWEIEYDWSNAQIALVPGQIGDTNLDGVVDAIDYMVVKRNLGTSQNGQAADGDFDKNGVVDWQDLKILLDHFGEGSPAAGVIPEPATLCLLAFGATALLRRRRQN